MKYVWLVMLFACTVARAGIPPEAQDVLNAYQENIRATETLLNEGDASAASSALKKALEDKQTFQKKFAGRLGPVTEFRNLNKEYSKLSQLLKASQSSGAASSKTDSRVMPAKPSSDFTSSDGPAMASKTDTSGRSSSDGPAIAQRTNTSGRTSSDGPAMAARTDTSQKPSSDGPALAKRTDTSNRSSTSYPGQPKASSGSNIDPKFAKAISDAEDALTAADTALASGDRAQAKSLAQNAETIMARDCSYSYNCRQLDGAKSVIDRVHTMIDAINTMTAQEKSADEDRRESARQLASNADSSCFTYVDGFGHVGRGERYYSGSTPEPAEIQEALELTAALQEHLVTLNQELAAYKAAGGSLDDAPNCAKASTFEAKFPQARKASLDRMLVVFDGELDRINNFYHGDLKFKNMDKLAEAAALAAQIDPAHTAMQDFNAGMTERKTELVERISAQIDAGKWPSRSDTFAGPGDADDLEKLVFGLLQKSPSWGENKKRPQEILAVNIQGPWQPAEWNILGQVVSWRLPMKVAITDPKLKPQGVAQVFDISMVTVQGPGDKTPQKPPFAGAPWVGSNYFMRIKNL